MKLYDILESTEERYVELVTEEDSTCAEEDRRDSDRRTCGLKLRCPEGSSLFNSAQSYGIGNLDVIKIGTGSTGLLRLIVKSLKE
jgi:hypothetical protein